VMLERNIVRMIVIIVVTGLPASTPVTIHIMLRPVASVIISPAWLVVRITTREGNRAMRRLLDRY